MPTGDDEDKTKDALQVFLCHSKEDKQTVRDLYDKLRADGFHPWLDERDLFQSSVRRSSKAIKSA